MDQLLFNRTIRNHDPDNQNESFEFLHFVSFRETIATRNLYDLGLLKISPGVYPE